MAPKHTPPNKTATPKKSPTANKNLTRAKANPTPPKASSKTPYSSKASTTLRLSSFLSPAKGSGVSKSSTTSKGSSLPKKAAMKVGEVEAEKNETETAKQEEKVTDKNGKKTASKIKGRKFGTPGGIRIYDRSVLKPKPLSSEVSVLMRPTERTRRLRMQTARDKGKTVDAAAVVLNEKEDGMETFRVMDLPKEVQVAIWREAVVYPDFFVWPESKTGAEQPDLAMVGREVREDALAVYYGENIFAVDVSPEQFWRRIIRRTATEPVTSLEALDRWSARVEEKGWFGMIRNWVFSCTPAPPLWCGFGTRVGDQAGSGFVVFVKFKPEHQKDGSKSWSAVVEVHREASCVLPAAHYCGKCIVRTAPEWLNNAVIEAINDANGGGIKAKSILSLVKTIRLKAAELMNEKCAASTGDGRVL